jgi:6-pyruvoyltetrahydropterin/6-carboxytetrahydropterin synthase
MYEVSREHSFSAAHRLRGYSGKCESLHGHNWSVRIHVRAETLDSLGMVVDFKRLRAELDRVLGELDHTLINEIPPFDRLNPTAENLARHVAETMDRAITDDRVAVHRCEVWESDGASATYVLPGR